MTRSHAVASVHAASECVIMYATHPVARNRNTYAYKLHIVNQINGHARVSATV